MYSDCGCFCKDARELVGTWVGRRGRVKILWSFDDRNGIKPIVGLTETFVDLKFYAY